MDHGNITREIALGLRVLRRRIAKANIPSSVLDESINIATWNIREFGRRRRMEASIHFIAEILNQFDLIAVTEVRDNLADLARTLKVLGPYWRAVFSDYIADAGGNRERFAYVYDKRAVTFTGLAAEADSPRKKDKKTKEYLPAISWWRKPYIASFRAGSFDFILLAAHIRWGGKAKERIAPLTLMAEWVDRRRKERHAFDKDIIVMGDFNIPAKGDRLYQAVTGKGLRMPKALFGVHGSNLARNKRYDQILHVPTLGDLFTDNGGVLDFYANSFKPLYRRVNKTKKEFTYELSDHLPLWIQLDVNREEAKLDQIIRSK